MRLTLACGMALGLAAGGAAAQNLLPNGSFEDAGPGFIVLDQWTNFTTNAVVVEDGDEVVENSGVFISLCPDAGNRAVKFFGVFPPPGIQGDSVLSLDFNNDGLEDFLPVTAGTTYEFAGKVFHSSADPMTPFGDFTPDDPDNFVLQGQFFILVVNFQDALGNNIDINGDGDNTNDGIVQDLLVADDQVNFPFDTWLPYSFQATAPAGATQAQHIYVFGSFSPVTGAAFLDDVSATEVVTQCSPADLNGDGNLNNTDINAFVSAFLGMQPAGDFNGDGNFNNTDVNLFVSAFLAGGCD